MGSKLCGLYHGISKSFGRSVKGYGEGLSLGCADYSLVSAVTHAVHTPSWGGAQI